MRRGAAFWMVESNGAARGVCLEQRQTIATARFFSLKFRAAAP